MAPTVLNPPHHYMWHGSLALSALIAIFYVIANWS